MHLELGSFPVDDVQESDRLSYADGVLGVDTEALRQLVLEGGEFADVSVHVVRPGDRTRLIHVIDAAEPRFKPAAGSTVPGFCGPVQMVGEGATHRLAGVAVVTTSDLVAGDPVYAPEAIIDMSGSAADLTPFSRTINVVLELEPHPKYLRPDTPDSELQSLVYRRQIRATELKVASHLARATEGLRPERVVPYELSKPAHTLPRVAYLLHDIPWIYGAQASPIHGDSYGSLPTLMHPNEVLDGALVSNRDYEGCSRDATYFYQNPSILSELYRRHGVDLDFVGVVLFTGGPDMDAKRLACEYAYKLLRMLDVQAVCASSSTSGNPWVEFMMLCQRCERSGIKTILAMPEEVGAPEDHGFSHYVPEAVAIVSTGRASQEIELPRVSTVIGGSELHEVSDTPVGPVSVPYTSIFGASTNIGQSWLTAREY
jgi:glycine reductase